MSVRLDMLRAATRGARALGESLPLVRSFLSQQLCAEGGFADRAGRGDVYYTVFGTLAMEAAGNELPVGSVRRLVECRAGGLRDMDLVHTACLARLAAAMDLWGAAGISTEEVARRLEQFRSADGGYNSAAGSATGSVYAAFLAIGAYQDMQLNMPRPADLVRSVQALRRPDGGYANHLSVPVSITTVTAAAVVVLRELGAAPDEGLGRWLLARCDPEGGFFASTLAPLPDLLSTATALHALAVLGADIGGVREPCLDFLDSLWSARGAFHGTWADDALDCEYTFYGLLALGYLAGD